MKLHLVAGTLDFAEGRICHVVLAFTHSHDYNDPRKARGVIIIDDCEGALLERTDNTCFRLGNSLNVQRLHDWLQEGSVAWQAHPEAGNLIVDPKDLDNVYI